MTAVGRLRKDPSPGAWAQDLKSLCSWVEGRFIDAQRREVRTPEGRRNVDS